MTTLNFEDTDAATLIVSQMARDDFDDYQDRLAFDEACERRGADAELLRAIDELGEDEAAEIYDLAYDTTEEDSCSND